MSQERSLETFQALADTLPPAQRYASDGLAVMPNRSGLKMRSMLSLSAKKQPT